MRVARVLMMCCASILLEAPTVAQQAPAPTRTVDEIVCQLADSCDQQKAQPTNDNSIAAPKTRSFSVYKPELKSSADVRPAVTTTVPPRASARSGASSGKSAGVRVANRRPSRANPAAAQERRIDLRLSFLLGSAQLTSQAQAEAKVFAQALLRPELADKRFLIEGHTDSTGSRAMNLDLSKRRAAAVVDYLNGLGVGRDRLDIRGYGPDRPLPGHRPTSPDNRRVEAKLL